MRKAGCVLGRNNFITAKLHKIKRNVDKDKERVNFLITRKIQKAKAIKRVKNFSEYIYLVRPNKINDASGDFFVILGMIDPE